MVVAFLVAAAPAGPAASASAAGAPGLAPAAPVATTGGVASVTATSAQLNGVVDAPSPLAVWFFQYSSSPTFSPSSLATPAIAAGPGLHAVSALVAHLSPGTVYYFRLGVVYLPALGLPQTGTLGSAQSFQTPQVAGVAAFAPTGTGAGGSLLRVRAGAAAIPIRCTGVAGAHCTGRLSLSVGGRRSTGCGSATVALAAPSRQLVPITLSRGCTSLLAGARRGSLAATLLLTSGSRSVSRRVTLGR